MKNPPFDDRRLQYIYQAQRRAAPAHEHLELRAYASNLKKRWVYLMLGSTAFSNPFVTPGHPYGKLKLVAASGVVDHLEATLELPASGGHYNIKIHDKHKKLME